MSKMATDYGAINLSQGFPNFPIDPVLVNILEQKSKENTHQYCPMSGLPILMQQVANKIEERYQRKIDIENELLITAGATQGIFTAIQALVHPGDEVIVLDPCYDDKVNTKTKMIITNNPHNPSGTIWSKEDWEKLEQLLLKFPKLLHLSDEVYEYITFEQKHISANSTPLLRERSVIVSSFGKTFHITGWKIGYVVAPNRLMDEIKKVHQFLVFCVNSVAQHTLSAYLEKTQLLDLSAFYQHKRDLFKSGMKNSRFKLLPCQGTYFQLASYEEISTESDVDFTIKLVKEFGLAAIPVSVFNENKLDRKHLRFCFAKTDETLRSATEILCKI
ncbi:MAG: aminotransferase class I/II-fold pyridoxal phosphate-dependent enzyme [Flavobacteriales bacterium]|nr:aminotransferase class I/II-fold pyridoxal phosphate-dependent enzyme [Flavobacteriales bacterium]